MVRRKTRRKASSARKRFFSRSVRIAGIIVFSAGVSFAYVWLHIQTVALGYTIKKEEGRLKLYRERSDALKLKVTRLKAPRRIERLMGGESHDFVIPEERHIVRMSGKPRIRRFASKGGGLRRKP